MYFCKKGRRHKWYMLGISNEKEADFMSGKGTQFIKTQKYRFDFGADDKLYTIIFHGKIPQVELKKMVSSLQNCLFERMPETILLYLKQHHYGFSGYNSIESTLEKGRAMGWANHLLNSEAYGKVDGNLWDADFHYAVMDCQENTQTYSEGCYFAATRTAWENGEPQHNAIVQTYLYHRETCEEYGYFAIRKTKGGILYTIDSLEGKPALPTFGSVDMMALLKDIEKVNSKEDAVKTAVK